MSQKDKSNTSRRNRKRGSLDENFGSQSQDKSKNKKSGTGIVIIIRGPVIIRPHGSDK